jgi:hypothetical protein
LGVQALQAIREKYTSMQVVAEVAADEEDKASLLSVDSSVVE